MAIKNKSNMNTRKNIYKKDESIKLKNNKIKSLFIRKSNNKIDQNEKIGKDQLQNISKSILGIILAISIFGFIVWGFIAMYQYATESEYFSIEEINYNGNKFLTINELEYITGLEINTNILAYRIKDIESELLKSPWIENVKIKRSLPNTIYIEIQEREPIFWATKDDILYYLDKNTNFIAPVTEEKFISLPTIDIKYANEKAIESLPDFLDMFKTIELPFSINEVSWFSINPGKGYELHLEKYNINISAAIENWKRNTKNLASAIRDLEKRNEFNKIKEIRSAHNQVTIIKN